MKQTKSTKKFLQAQKKKTNSTAKVPKPTKTKKSLKPKGKPTKDNDEDEEEHAIPLQQPEKKDRSIKKWVTNPGSTVKCSTLEYGIPHPYLNSLRNNISGIDKSFRG